MLRWINATTVESQCPWTSVFGVSIFFWSPIAVPLFWRFCDWFGWIQMRWRGWWFDFLRFQPLVITQFSTTVLTFLWLVWMNSDETMWLVIWLFAVSASCDHPIQYHCFDIFVTGLDEFRWDHVVGDLTFWGFSLLWSPIAVECIWNVMAHAQKPDFVFRRNGRVHLNQQGHQFSRLLAAEVCWLAVVMLDTPCSKVVWRVLATYSICQFPFTSPLVHHHVPSRFNWTVPLFWHFCDWFGQIQMWLVIWLSPLSCCCIILYIYIYILQVLIPVCQKESLY